MTLSDRLQELRKTHHLSQEQLAEKLDVSRQAISKWESAQANPDINNVMKLSRIYGVSIDYILTGREFDSQADSGAGDHSGTHAAAQTVHKENSTYKENARFKKLNDLPSSVRTSLAVFIIAFGVFVVVPILFVLSMELLSFIF